MRILIQLVTVLCIYSSGLAATAQDGNRFTYLDDVSNPYYVSRDFPKLATPQWVGEQDVEAVVVLAIDDMRDPAKYENYLRPILNRLKQIDGRAPVSIMTCNVGPDDPQLQAWLKEGLSIECHTIDHPCPLLQGGDFAKAKSTYDRCVDTLAKIPGNKPVAFRVPCCDSRNTPSPRFWGEIFDRFTPNGNYLHIDSSVFNITTADDKDLPRELVFESNGRPRFQKYVPFPSFVNTIKDYPYPYLIGGGCWEFPCTVPSDWEAQHLHKPNNPQTVEDLNAALDATVIKQGVMNLVFHPHGWIRNDQMVEFIDHAIAKHGSKVKFLSFKEAYQRIRENLLLGQDMGNFAFDPGIRLLDVNADGHLDVIHGGRLNAGGQRLDQPAMMRIWQPVANQWKKIPFPVSLIASMAVRNVDLGTKFGVLQKTGNPSLLIYHKTGQTNAPHSDSGIWHFDGEKWQRDDAQWQSLQKNGTPLIPERCEGVCLRDLDDDGICELIVAPAINRGKQNSKFDGRRGAYKLDRTDNQWHELPFELPEHVQLTAQKTKQVPDFPDGGLRFVDVNEDGFEDIIFSNDRIYSLQLWKNTDQGWSNRIIEGEHGKEVNGPVIPMIVRKDGTNNGVWFHSKHLWVQNENTNQMPDGVDRLSFDQMLAGTILIGAAKIDITPGHPVRLSGYGNRRSEADEVAQQIWAKALVIGRDDEPPAVLITVENCGMTPAIRNAVAQRLFDAEQIRNERIVISASHTHSAPCLTNWAPFIFSQDIPQRHQKNIDRYTSELTDKLVTVVQQANKKRQPGRLSWTQGQVGFAANRRVIQSGVWSGFGVQNGGPVDHSLPILAAKNTKGKLIAVVANYACHCTTMGGDFNKIAGDWAGYAQEFIEAEHPDAVALITIGCGADANPSPRGNLELSKQHGRALADEVNRLLTTELTPILKQPKCKLQMVDLPFSTLPDADQWEAKSKQGGTQGYHARQFLKRVQAGEKIPDSISYPVATWTFGNDLAMVFLGGEVVVDYAIRMKQEFDGKKLWISAYSNDVPCYIASKRVLREGGYEADSSMLYYARPARLADEVEDIVVDAVQKLLPPRFYSAKKQLEFPPPQSPRESLSAIRTNLIVELVAAEPLVMDPVAFDWGPDGRLWVVEMGDYPNGLDWNGSKDPIGNPGGRIKVLDDDDGDGIYDRAKVFMNGIPFPTGIKVWRDGILVTAAPEIFFAKDTDGDDVADTIEPLYRGFGEGNQQHRVNGLRWGLDNWLYVGNGDSGGNIKSLKTGDVVNVSGRDLRIKPDVGLIEARSGQTQFGICRDDWGNWFGGNNSNPIWHYVLEDRYLKRNPHVVPPKVQHQVSVQPGNAPVFPTSRTLARFNNLDQTNRFTSACSPIIYRDNLIGAEDQTHMFVCEPVHNLVHREILNPTGSTFTSRRVDSETDSEFLTSTDSWFRPSMVRTGPDGALWVADMYRFVIEHPKWIPETMQRKLDLRAGDTMGRIYRVRPAARPARKVPRLDKLNTAELVSRLNHSNGWQRDMAQQLLLWRNDKSAVQRLSKMVQSSGQPTGRLHALCTLDGLGEVTPELVELAINDGHPAVRRHGVRLAEPLLKDFPALVEQLGRLTGDPDPFVRMQVAYSLGESKNELAGRYLVQLARQNPQDRNLTAAIVSSLNESNLKSVVSGLADEEKPIPELFVQQVFTMTAAIGDKELLSQLVMKLLEPSGDQFSQWQFSALQMLIDTLGKNNESRLKELSTDARNRIAKMFAIASRIAGDPGQATSERLASIKLLGSYIDNAEEAYGQLVGFLSPQNSGSIQSAAVAAIVQQQRPMAANDLLENWQSYTPALRAQVFDALLSRPAWTNELVNAVERGDVMAAHFDARQRQKLVSHPSESVRQRTAAWFATSTDTTRQRVLQDYQESVALIGDRARGKLHFEKHCSACHRLENVGHNVGPDLMALTDKSTASLLVAMLDPNRAVEDKFLEYVAETDDGQLLSGMITDETAVSLTLTSNDGKEHKILRAQLEGFRSSGKSLMPEGIERDLSPQEVANVIAYVRGFASPHKKFPGNEPAIVTAGKDGNIRLPATRARVYGPSLIFEPQYKNLGYWQSSEDHALWQLNVPRAGSYRVSFDYACHQNVAGKRFKLTAAGRSLSGVVAGTGTWDNYQTKPIGTLELPSGPVELIIRSDGPINGAMINLRTIELTPTTK